MKTDTIAAIATALSESGIGIIRISGPEAVIIGNKIFKSKNEKFELIKAKSHSIHYGYIYDGTTKIDEVLISVMLGPNSYTAEDVVEINCHGGILLMQKIMELVVKMGARVAEPGEFTRRAFLNGRIDLSEAEAVMDIISSKNEFALQSSVKQLSGSVSKIIKDLRAKIIYEIAFIESALDDPENYDTEGYSEKLESIVIDIQNQVQKLIKKSDNGKLLKEGINTVIVGKPNAGKSSFLNRLVGEEKAIVTEIAGTTRDVLTESIRLNGISLNLTDTAGIRETDDVVEKIGVSRAKKYAEDADLILFIVDSSVKLDDSDFEILNLIKDRKSIILLNKSDMKSVIAENDILNILGNTDQKIIKISALEGYGIDEFEEAISEMFFKGDVSFNDEVVITSLRHKEALIECDYSLTLVLHSIKECMSEDFFSVDLMNAYASLGRIIGEEVDDDLVNEIFAKFCMGK